MCRWLVYQGEPIFMEQYVTCPENSLISQSHHAQQAVTVVNGDGLGVGWYNHLEEPGLFKDTSPAWSNANMRSLCAQVRSGLFFAHVRAATGTAVNQMNCHPFVCGRWMFMHNGQIGSFKKVRREVEALISNEFYEYRYGTTDTEAIFLAILSHMLSHDNPVDAVIEVINKIKKLMHDNNVSPLRFTATLTDGQTIYAFRLASDEFAPSLYYCQSDTGLIIASEPLNCDTSLWNEVPAQSVVVINKGKLQISAT